MSLRRYTREEGSDDAVVGYYNCFDVFKLTVDRTRRRPVEWRDEAAPVGL